MKTFKSLAEVEKAGLSPPEREVVHAVVKGIEGAYAEYGETHVADEHGFTVLIEEGDTDADLEAEAGYNLREAIIEGVYREGVYFCAVVLHNNEYGLSFCIPDAPWLDPELRAKLMAECGEEVRK